MSHKIGLAGVRHLADIQAVNRGLTEKALYMRAQSYLAQIKTHLLNATIVEIDRSKKVVVKTAKELELKSATIAEQQLQLERQNQQLQLSQDELQQLVAERTKELVAVNRQLQQEMQEKEAAQQELERLNRELEARVEERTADLNRAVKLMAGREVRMAELKEEIAALQEEIARLKSPTPAS